MDTQAEPRAQEHGDRPCETERERESERDRERERERENRETSGGTTDQKDEHRGTWCSVEFTLRIDISTGLLHPTIPLSQVFETS